MKNKRLNEVLHTLYTKLRSEGNYALSVDITDIKDAINIQADELKKAAELLENSRSIYKEDCVFDINWNDRKEKFLKK